MSRVTILCKSGSSVMAEILHTTGEKDIVWSMTWERLSSMENDLVGALMKVGQISKALTMAWESLLGSIVIT